MYAYLNSTSVRPYEGYILFNHWNCKHFVITPVFYKYIHVLLNSFGLYISEEP